MVLSDFYIISSVFKGIATLVTKNKINMIQHTLTLFTFVSWEKTLRFWLV